MKEKVEFFNSVVKQGNSLCIRIPSTASKELNLGEGDEVAVRLVSIQKTKFDEKDTQNILEIAKKIKKLRKYSEMKQRFFIALNFEMLKSTYTKKEKEREKKRIEFIKMKKKEFGSKIIDEFVDWAYTIYKVAFIKEKDGSRSVLKAKYR